MFQIAILATENCVASQAIGIMDFFDFCNSAWQFLHKDKSLKPFNYQLFGSGEQIQCSNGILLNCKPMAQANPMDAVFVVAAYADDKPSLSNFLSQSCAFDDYLIQAVKHDVPVASYCAGAFALAHSGVLEKGKATTSWWMKNLFQQRYADIELIMDQLVVEHNGVITGGATTAYFNVCLLVLEKLTSPEFALQMSKILLIDRHRLSQQAYMNTSMLIGKQDCLIDDIQQWMLQHYAEGFSLEGLCQQFSLSKRTLLRRFKQGTGDTPLQYLQKIRVEKAKEMLESTHLAVERIVERVGYEDPASFRKLFLQLTQLTPRQYRQRFSHHGMELS